MDDASGVTAREVAEWMADEVTRMRYMEQSYAAHRIESMFGGDFTYTNSNHNLAIRKDVLDAFEDITRDTVVWLRKRRTWRPREERDTPGRQQYWPD